MIFVVNLYKSYNYIHIFCDIYSNLSPSAPLWDIQKLVLSLPSSICDLCHILIVYAVVIFTVIGLGFVVLCCDSPLVTAPEYLGLLDSFFIGLGMA